jgi:hypothetical protein
MGGVWGMHEFQNRKRINLPVGGLAVVIFVFLGEERGRKCSHLTRILRCEFGYIFGKVLLPKLLHLLHCRPHHGDDPRTTI